MSPSDQTISLITGANGGIGFELALQLLASSSALVLLGARSPEKGEAAIKDLKSRNLPGRVELVTIDISSDDSVTTAAKHVEEKYGHIDALINNAAITGNGSEPLSSRMSAAFLTNATGTAIVGEAFEHLLAKSDKVPRIVNVSTGAGSIGMRLDYENEHQKLKSVCACHFHIYVPTPIPFLHQHIVT